jgi:hypothetical protein
MTYYTVENENGQFFTGGMKLCSPPLLMFSDKVDDAKVWRNHRCAMNTITRATGSEGWKVTPLESRDHPRLAD